jgi:uncharacterized membrane protein (UPF0127 family)
VGTAFFVRSSVLAALAAGLIAALVVAFVVLPGRGRASASGALGVCPDPSAPYAEVQIDTYPRINLELARTPQEHEVGLMNREYLPPDNGMLFVYQSEAREAYWMYHTLIPLSIAWIAQDGTIVDIQDMARLNDPSDVQEASRTVYSPAAPYWYALEVNEGWYLDHGVGVGQQIVFCVGA